MFAFRNRLNFGPISLFSLGFAFLLTALPLQGTAQSSSTAHKSTDISVFAGFDSVTPDYDVVRDNGIGFGANITRYFHFPVKPSLEARVNLNNGPTVNEHTYLFGARGQVDLHRFHPYADFLIGPGYIHYNFIPNPANPSYRNDNSVVESIGGGVDIDLYRNFQLKGDYQGQFWKLGTNDTLAPRAFLIGIAYRIPFHPNYKTISQR